MSPIMEILTGVMIAILIFYSGILMSNGELEINNFFSFLAAMMLAYQPVRSLSTLNMVLNQGLSAASRILPIIDQRNNINDSINAKQVGIKNSNINFQNVNFSLNFQALSSVGYVESLLRPLALLLARSFLPPFVDILDLKPCLLFLTSLLG